MENLDIEKQSIVLLTSYFKKPGKDDVNPLTPTEWKIFAEWLIERGYTPGSLLSEDGENIIESWRNDKITRERLINLLKRGAQMSMVLEKWSRAGIWILTRSDKDYPQKLKTRLGQLSPPVLFGSGNKKLLNFTGIAVVGSREVSDIELDFTKELAKSISENDLTIISGGARGIDETSMISSLANNGNAIGILADSLFQKSISQIYRNYLSEGKLALISPYYPEAGFNVGNAMGRNKYIYCLSEAAIVVHSGLKGGTWTGAVENLKKKWVPLYVKPNKEKESGNTLLIKNGGLALNEGLGTDEIINLILKGKSFIVDEYKVSTVHEPRTAINTDKYQLPDKKQKRELPEIKIEMSFYDFFISKLISLLKQKEVKQKEINENFDINPAQLKEWLNKAEKDGLIQKLTKPVRFRLVENNFSQANLFN